MISSSRMLLDLRATSHDIYRHIICQEKVFARRS